MSQSNRLEASDFWWLSEHEIKDDLFVGVGHHPPLSECDTPLPLSKWSHSLDEDMQPSLTYRQYPLDFLVKWRSVCNNTNVYRTLELFANNQKVAKLLGPFLVDIDNENCKDGYEVDLDDALVVARKVLNLLTSHWNLSYHDIRIFFSGHKGFNIEVRTQVLSIDGSVADQRKLSAEVLQKIINHFGTGSNTVSKDTTIDQIYGNRFNNYELKHPYIRLHESWNKWFGENGIRKARRKIELTPQELAALTVDKICANAERPE